MARKKEQIPESQKALIDQLIRERGGPQALFDKGGLFDALKKRFIEQALEAEMDEHLDQLEINPPRHRNSTFEPQLMPKRQLTKIS